MANKCITWYNIESSFQTDLEETYPESSFYYSVNSYYNDNGYDSNRCVTYDMISALISETMNPLVISYNNAYFPVVYYLDTSGDDSTGGGV